VRLGTGIGAAGYVAVTGLSLIVEGPLGRERPQQIAAAVLCAVAFALSRSRPAAAAVLAIGTIWLELLCSMWPTGMDAAATMVFPLLVTATGLLLGGRACLVLAAVSGAVVPLVVTASRALGGSAPPLDLLRLLILEIVVAASAALSWSALRVYAALLVASERERVRVVREAAEREALEERLRHAQRLETVGQLAGGIAHDFNNLMTAIGGNASVLVAHADPEVRELARDIEDAQRRGAGLTRQLLAFARREVRRPEPLDLVEAICGTGRLLERILGEQHRLELRSSGEVPVLADRGQLEQVAVNLVKNARDAMPRGGVVRVAVRALDRAEAAALGSSLDAPRQALLEVSDEGQGMSPDVAARAFEPFYTTKPRGQGTGLGLATVHGIAAQSGGQVALDTAPGHGATLRVFLPLGRAVAARAASAPAPAPAGGPERILLVEDDPHVRHLAHRVLDRAGYDVTVAASGAEALQAFPGAPEPRLLLTDVAMPGMSGPDLAARLRAAAPDLRVLFMSGYYDAALADTAALDPARELVEKPFSPDVLLRRVRAALDRAA
jgi:signal transduction histidine kinase